MAWDHLIMSTFWHLWCSLFTEVALKRVCALSPAKTRVLVIFKQLRVIINMHIAAGAHLTCTLFPSLRESSYFCLSRPTGPSPALARSLNSVVMATETSWQLECISYEKEDQRRALCIYSCCLFTINGYKYLYGLEDIFTAEERRRPVAGRDMSWWSGPCQTWLHKCISP